MFLTWSSIMFFFYQEFLPDDPNEESPFGSLDAAELEEVFEDSGVPRIQIDALKVALRYYAQIVTYFVVRNSGVRKQVSYFGLRAFRGSSSSIVYTTSIYFHFFGFCLANRRDIFQSHDLLLRPTCGEWEACCSTHEVAASRSGCRKIVGCSLTLSVSGWCSI